jgi:hypothetical protein
MLYLSAFYGRTVSHINVEEHMILVFADFSMSFISKVEFVSHPLLYFVGQKFLYIQKNGMSVHFHFTSNLYLTIRIGGSSCESPQLIKLQNREKEVIMRIDDGTVFEGV